MARTKAVLGDARRDERAEWMLDRIVATGSLVLREIGGARAGEMAAHRLLSCDDVDPTALLAPHVARTAAACKGRRVVAVQDTSEINFDRYRHPAAGLGPTGNTGIRGFFVHPIVAVDADDAALLGVVGAQIWTRGEEPTPMHHDIPYDEKESRRWLEAAEIAATHLAPVATQVVVVADREGDIYPMFARCPEAIDFVVRANHNRVLAEGGTLFAAPAAWQVLGTAQVKVTPKQPGDKGRRATVTLKAGTVTIKRPRSAPDRQDMATLTLGLVEVREVAKARPRRNAPAGAGQPLLWRLVTTLPVATIADAQEVVRLYRLRWRIEEVFRILKNNGLKIEDSQLETADRLFNLAALGLVAAARVIQLVDARDGSTRPATDVIAPEEIEAAAAISAALEGGTERQKNPHEQGSLAWMSWITARLGGWNCYYKPPGPKTMARGLDRLIDRIEGFKLAAAPPDV
jgi:DDE family transposase